MIIEGFFKSDVEEAVFEGLQEVDYENLLGPDFIQVSKELKQKIKENLKGLGYEV